ncbi:MAG: hypothetical protein HQL08_06600 [Nitrospirae bacterium]|nr:hypothetical protein [Nitrospirota bacterium]
MIKFLKVLVLAMLVVGLMTSGVMAGTTAFRTSTGATTFVKAPLEAMGVARTITLGGIGTSGGTGLGANNAAFSIFPSQTINSGSLLTVTFGNAGMPVTTVVLCAANNDAAVNGTPLYSLTTTVNQTVMNFLIGNTVPSGTTMFLTNVAGGPNTTAPNCISSNGALQVTLLPTTSAKIATMTWTAYAAGFSGVSIDTANATANFANIAKQYSTTILTANNSSIDFVNAPGNGTTFAGNTTLAAKGTVNFVAADFTGGLDGVGNGLAVSGLISLQDTAAWQAVSSVFLVGNDIGCSSANTYAIANGAALTGTVNIAVPTSGANNFSGANATSQPVTICVSVAGNQVIQSRTITEQGTVVVTGSGAQQQATTTAATLFTWLPNGYQGIVTYVSGSSTYNTICFVSNQSSTSAPVTLSVLTTESGATLTALQSISLGSVAGKGTMRVDLSQTATPYTYASSTETAGTATTLTGVASNDRYTALFNVGANPSSVTVNCIQADPAGSKRAVPVVVPQTNTTVPYVY